MSVSSNVGAYYEDKCKVYEGLLFEVLEILADPSVYPPADLECLAPVIRKTIRKSEANKARLASIPERAA